MEPQPHKDASDKALKGVNTEKVPKELLAMVKKSDEVLFRAESVFPFILFPDTIILDRTHLTVIHRSFFKIAKKTSARIEDILTCDLNLGPFFASLKFTTRYFMNQKTEDEDHSEVLAPAIEFLHKREAEELHKLIQGYIEVKQKDIDTTKIPLNDLKKLLKEIGASE